MLKVFISFSGSDRALVNYLEKITRAIAGVAVYRFDHDVQPGVRIAEKVKRAIRSAHVVVVLLTRSARKSAWVQQEIGIAEQAGRVIVPIVERGVDAPGVLEGREYVELDAADPAGAFRRAAKYLAKLETRLQAKRASDRKAAVAALALIGGAIVAIGAASKR
ncbi:MAG: toll/interleukin-1 receptor domain-containing protein [Acidobacteria bacterium]|nr:toll/interleukin-1 receptor domain-containing protein [Acidobacteriota bacterium]